MTLITSTSQLRKAGVKIDVKFDFDLIKPAIEKVEQQILIPLISRGLYDSIHSEFVKAEPAYATGELALLPYLQTFVATVAFLKKAPSLGIIVDDSGSYKNKAEDKWFLSEIETASWIKALQEEATDSREIIIQYLENYSNAIDLHQYYTSDLAIWLRELRIKNADHFSQYHELWPRWSTFRLLRPYMKSVQFDRIKPVMNGWYNDFITRVPASELERDLIYSAERAIVKLSLAKALKQRGVSLSTEGVIILNEKERYGTSLTASAEQILSTHDALLAEGEKALSDVEKLLLELLPVGFTPPEELEDLNDPDSNLYFA